LNKRFSILRDTDEHPHGAIVHEDGAIGEGLKMGIRGVIPAKAGI